MSGFFVFLSFFALSALAIFWVSARRSRAETQKMSSDKCCNHG